MKRIRVLLFKFRRLFYRSSNTMDTVFQYGTLFYVRKIRYIRIYFILYYTGINTITRDFFTHSPPIMITVNDRLSAATRISAAVK